MHASRFLIHTLKEAPADAEIISHQLMIRSGMIQRIAAGIYAFMPLGVRVMRKIEAIVRGEMNRAGALEALMPMVQPARRCDIRQSPARSPIRISASSAPA